MLRQEDTKDTHTRMYLWRRGVRPGFASGQKTPGECNYQRTAAKDTEEDCP
jgi:hypothetical protein